MSHAMASGEAEAMDADEAVITRGTGNLLADPGHPDAEERQTRPRPAQVIDGLIGCERPPGPRRRGWASPDRRFGARQLPAGRLLDRAHDAAPRRAGLGRRDRHPRQAEVAGGRADRRECGAAGSGVTIKSPDPVICSRAS